MKKLLIIIGVATLCLNFNASAQKALPLKCRIETIANYKWGFAPFKNGFKSVAMITPLAMNKWRRLIAYNQTLPQLYGIALGAGKTFNDDRIIIEVREPRKLELKMCYELNTPPELNDVMFALMQKNLEYKFPDYVASIVQRNGVNYILVEDKEFGILIKAEANQKSLNARNNTY